MARSRKLVQTFDPRMCTKPPPALRPRLKTGWDLGRPGRAVPGRCAPAPGRTGGSATLYDLGGEFRLDAPSSACVQVGVQGASRSTDSVPPGSVHPPKAKGRACVGTDAHALIRRMAPDGRRTAAQAGRSGRSG